MAESREDRLSRIRAVIESPETTNAILGSYTADGDWWYINFPDVAWLLEQIPTAYEYRVEYEDDLSWNVWTRAVDLSQARDVVANDEGTDYLGKPLHLRVSRRAAAGLWNPIEDAS